MDNPRSARQRWMSVLARAETDRLRALLEDQAPLPEYTVLRGPEAGLVMVRGRAGGGGAAFNLGEMTVTRCTVRTETGLIGHAYVQGRDEKRAELAALTDALMLDPGRTDALERQVITPLECQQEQRKEERAAKAAATRVQFLAMQTMRT
ncbi:MAG TPA: phosphonate C-P lyase system protein PhnG [Acetobacteraceae bacterium]|nr:phosphonate C-P lyase system protein PhnG [Acetobacteraceae bacterium]